MRRVWRQIRHLEVMFELDHEGYWSYVYACRLSPTGEMRSQGWWRRLEDAVKAAREWAAWNFSGGASPPGAKENFS